MSEKSGIVFVIAGAVLILSALSLFFYNQNEDAQAGREAGHLLSDVQAVIKEKETQTPVIPEETPAPELPVTEIEGYEYVGFLSVPDLELELPVMAEWDYARLKIAPCRQFGSSRTDDLVIAAHNYKNHFGRLSELESGDTIMFTDMDGIENLYEVAFIDTLAPTEVETVQNSDYDLVLYTCTYGGRTRVAVFCSRSADSVPSAPDLEEGAVLE
ncbi:MAG: sortase [Clostridiales bacterium]|nr:sortase [Clostridiales bacterium]